MPHWWFYKLRDFGKTTNKRTLHSEDKPNATEIQWTISPPRSNYYKFDSSERFSERVYASPIFNYSAVSDIHIPEAKKKQKEGIRMESRRRINATQRKNHRPSGKLVEARISAGCSCRTRITTRRYLHSNRKRNVLKKASNVVRTRNRSRDFEISRDFQRKYRQAPEKKHKTSTDRCKSRVCHVPKSSNTVEKATLYDALKAEDLDELEAGNKAMEDPALNRDYGRKCSAFWCSCKLSFSSIGADAESLSDVGLSSGDDDSEDNSSQVPILNKCSSYNSLVLGMKLKFLPTVDDLKKSAATLFRRRDDHAQAQAKLGEMIRAKGCKRSINYHRYDHDHHQNLMECPIACRDSMESVHFNENEKWVPNSQELYRKSINHAESDSKIALHDCDSFSESFYKSKKRTPATVISDSQTEIKEVEPKRNPHHGKENSGSNNRSKIDHGSPRLRREYWRPAEQNVPVPSEAQKRISESFAIVKCSYDPRRDFRESMVEMILKNDICESKDLQELVRCYVSLNSEEYHPVILEVFDQIQSSLLGINA